MLRRIAKALCANIEREMHDRECPVVTKPSFYKPQRTVHTVFIHCSASDKLEHNDWEVIDRWHKARGWDEIGYHYFITLGGTIQPGRHPDRIPAAQKGHNTGSLAICLHGLNHFSQEQFSALRTLCESYDGMYGNQLVFKGHREVDPSKECPVFDYRKVLNLDDYGRIQYV